MAGIKFTASIRVAVSRIGIGVIGLSVAAAPAQAGVGDEMSDFFNDMGASANATGAIAYQGQSVGLLYAGLDVGALPAKEQ
jgi:conjugative transfer pilus assembly protein TraH